MSVFTDAAAAAVAAEQAQRRLQEADWGSVGEVPVRMAIDVGDVDVRDGDYFGPPLNRCARILAAAHGGQVLLSSTAFDDLSTGHLTGVQIRQLGPYRLRGLAAPERVGQLVFVGLRAEFPELRLDASAPDLGERWEMGGLPGYELRERLGLGWSGPVYRAYQPSVGREVAIRVIRADLANEPTFVRRFEAHAREVAQLEHPHIVPLHDFWRDHQGAYLVMQLMRGGTLAREMREHAWKPQAVATLLRQIGAALAHAHSEDVVHGDIRPENILLDGAGNAYLSDFGLTPVLLPSEETSFPSVAACPYIAPEVRQGSAPSVRADVFSVAAIAAALLGGQPPSVRGEFGRLSSHLGDPLSLEAALMRAMSWKADDRFADVASFLEVVEGALALDDLPAQVPVRTGLRNPFKGLRAFTEGDAGDFHGRSELVDTLVAAVGMRNLVAVVGPSGSGKSSAVQAGLIPRLRAGALPGSGEWFMATMTPGAHPISALVDAIRPLAVAPLGDAEGNLAVGAMNLSDLVRTGLPGCSELVLVVDQFEELFTLVLDEDERERFISLIAATCDPDCPVRIVLTLRADFYDKPLAHGSLAQVVAAGLVTVVPPTVDDLVEAIERPAGSVGLAFEPGLPLRIASDVVGQPGGLPLLQYALTEMVEKRGADLLTSLDYEAIGTVAGAVARRAEATFAALDQGERAAAKDVLLRLVSVDAESDFTRRRVRLGELESLDHHSRAVRRAMDAFASSRLLSFDRDPGSRAPTVEVAHEALLREWGRLREWLADEREGIVLARRLRGAVGEWLESGRSDDYLLLGDRLSPFQQWARVSSLTADEQDFLEHSANVEATALAAQQRRRRAVLAALSAAALVAIVLAVAALVQGSRADRETARAQTLAALEADARALAQEQATFAEEQADLAEEQAVRAEEQAVLADEAAHAARNAELLAEARELAAAAVSVGDEDPQLAMLLALEAFEVAPEGSEIPVELTFSLREAMYANRLDDVLDVGDGADSIRISPSGTSFALSLWGTEELAMFDLETMEERWRLEGAAMRLIALGPDDEYLLTYTEEALELRSADDASLLETIPVACPPGQWSTGEWSPDGSQVAYFGSGCQAVVVLETEAWTEERRIPLTSLEAFMGVEFASSVGAHRLLVSEWYPEASGRVFDTETFELVAEFDTPLGTIDPGGATYFGTHYGDTPQLFDVESGDVIDKLSGMGVSPSTYMNQQFSHDGSLVMIPTEGSMIPIWDVATGEVAFRIPAGQRASSAFAPDGRLLTIVDGLLQVWDLSAAPGELLSSETGGSFAMWNARSSGTYGAASVMTPEGVEAYSFDVGTGALGPSRRLAGSAFPWIGVLGELGLVLSETRETNATQVLFTWNPSTGDERILLDCAEDQPGCSGGQIAHVGMISSVDGSEFGLLTTENVFLTWDADGVPRAPVPLDYGDPGINQLFLSFTDEWVVVRNNWSDHKVFDREGNLIEEFDLLGQHPWHLFDASGRYALGWGFDLTTSLLDATDWSVQPFTEDLGEGSVRGAGFSPSSELVALGIQGGPMRVYTVPDGELIARVPLDSAHAIFWVDEAHVAVGTGEGLWTVVTLDIDELREIAEGMVLRDFTPDECRTYRIGSCATGSSDG
ncbi:MAG: protein kinase [Acidimicrobiia bacterium]|nr:MAG: protein kinase [Acidimicrobiia bacterium]